MQLVLQAEMSVFLRAPSSGIQVDLKQLESRVGYSFPSGPLSVKMKWNK